MGYIARENQHRVYYENYGSGDSAVVLLHGWGMSVRMWDHTLPALRTAGHRVVMMDHRGCGESDKDFADMSIAAIAGDAVALIHALGLKRVVLNGWSLGGAVAVEAAGQLGQQCVGLVLTCAASPVYLQKPDFPHGGTEEAMEETIEALRTQRVTFLAALAQGICASDVGEVIERWMWQSFMQASPMALATLAELGPLDQREQLAALEIPIVSMVGAKDAVVDPEVCRSVAKVNPAAKLVEFAEAGHAPFIESPAKYNEVLEQFLVSCHC